MNRFPPTKSLVRIVVVVLFVFHIVVAPSLCSQCDQQQVAFSFGFNIHGQLGDGTTTDRVTPVAVSTSGVLNRKTITAISAGGGSHSLVLSSKKVFSFGDNSYGQLGDGTNTNSDIPVAVTTTGALSGKTITAISAGYGHSLVLSSSGQVFSFGWNQFGQLGDGTTTNRNTPVAVSTSGVLNGKTITAISAGSYHSLVLSSTGEVFSFGYNSDGELGDGTNTNRNIPVAVSTSGVLSGTTITAISAGYYHSLVLSSTGKVFSFGQNDNGQLGDGTTTIKWNPVAVSTSGVLNGKTITAIAAGGGHSLVLSSTGQVFSFGRNDNGQLGDSSTAQRNVPVAVSTSGVLNGKTITAIAAGGYHSLVLSSHTATGEVFSFGDNFDGQLGDGTTTDRNTPVAVSTSGVFSWKNITSISAGGYHSLALGMSCLGFPGLPVLPDMDTMIFYSESGIFGFLVFIIIVLMILIALTIACFSIIFLIRRSRKPSKLPTRTSSVTPRLVVPALSPVNEQPLHVSPSDSRDLSISPIESSSISPEEFSDFQQIGNGAYGIVYRAIYRGTAVAMKTLDIDTHHGKEFLQEAMTMAQLRHPRLLQFVGSCTSSNGKFGIVTEFMERGSLDLWLWKKADPSFSMPWPVKMGILSDVASGMAFLHSKGFIHRDLKSPNILIGSDFRAKIGDFGLARAVDKATSTMTNNQGTPMWMAPEVIGGTGHYDHKCDVFSFGIIMCEVMTEKEPYHHIPSKQTVMVNVFNNPNFRPLIPSLEEVVTLHNIEEDKQVIPIVFEAFIVLMQECWSHDSSSRPTFDQVVEQLNLMGATF